MTDRELGKLYEEKLREFRKNTIGEIKTMKDGLKAKITSNEGEDGYVIEFLDDGKIVHGCSYGEFATGRIAHKDAKSKNAAGTSSKRAAPQNRKENGNAKHRKASRAAKERIGETRTMNCGMAATIQKYANSKCVDVIFENGVVVRNRTYDEFVKGEIKNPKIHVGETATNRKGKTATIISSRNSKGMTVQFQDGAIRENVTYASFLRGEVSHPDDMKAKHSESRIGMRFETKGGFGYTVTKYKKSNDVTVTFDDGAIGEHKKWLLVEQGSVRLPVKSSFAGFDIKPAWESDGEHYYNCRCKECGYEDILTPAQMLEHREKHS